MTQQLAGLLRQLRDQAGLTQEQLAERSTISVRTIRRLEKGEPITSRLDTLNLLFQVLAPSPEQHEQLIALVAAPNAPVIAPEPGTPAPHGMLADAFWELAREVGRRWRHEEEQRRVHDPYPLPVRWREAPPALADHAATVRRLGPVAGPITEPLDLTGDLPAIVDTYRRIPSGRLVILGRAGSGKSILAVRFTLDMLKGLASAYQVPVIFSLGSWDPVMMTLREWLIDRLLRDHPYLGRKVLSGTTTAAALIDAGHVLPVLDGFDEIAEGLRPAALQALNDTAQPLLLTSRADEYAQAAHHIQRPLSGAAVVELADLTVDDLEAYLPRTAATSDWDAVLKRLRDDPDAHLTRVLTTPLMVILARTIYSGAAGQRPQELLDAKRFPDVPALEEHLLAGFVPAVYRPGPSRQHPARAQRWLHHLAVHVDRADPGRQDLAWWQLNQSVPRVVRSMIVAAVSGAAVFLTDCLIGLFAPRRFSEVLLEGLFLGAATGIAFAAMHLLLTGRGKRFEPSYVQLRLARHPRNTLRHMARAFMNRFGVMMLGGSILGVGCAMALALQRALSFGTSLTAPGVVRGLLVNMLAYGLILGVAAGLVFGIIAALETPLDVTSAATPAGLLAANRTTARRQILTMAPVLAVAVALCGTLFVLALRDVLGPMNWAWGNALHVGILAGVGGALAHTLNFTAWGQWATQTRLWLPLRGHLPWNPLAFLQGAYGRGVLRQAGAVYQFRHSRLQGHLVCARPLGESSPGRR